MKDTIDKLNEKNRIRKSIIKYWNVNYVPVLGEIQVPGASGNTEAEDDIEKDADRDDVRQGISVSEYGSGADDINDVTKGQIDKILHEKADAIQKIVAGGDA